MYFIILTTALTLHRHGITDINTSREAAAALAPLAGPFAATLFTIGIVGVGLVALPALITSSAYALAESFRWRKGLFRNFQAARPFYSVIILSCLVGIALDFTDVSPMMALYLGGDRQRPDRAFPSRRAAHRRFRPENHARTADLVKCATGHRPHRGSHIRHGHRHVVSAAPAANDARTLQPKTVSGK
jgi:Natural resistance-associated macrophage protein-like